MMATPVSCVVDASVGIKLVINEGLSAEAHALFASPELLPEESR